MPDVKFELDQSLVKSKINNELEKYDKKEQKLLKESTGIDPGYIANMLQKGESQQKISLPAVILFAKAFKRPIEYFIYSEDIYLNILEKEFIYIPYIKNCSNNEGNIVLSEKQHVCAMRYESLIKLTDNPKNIVLYENNSDVMENTFSKGDEVIIDISKKDVYDGMIYAYNSFNFNCIRIRRFSVQVDNLKLIADNRSKYEPCHADKKDINIIGQVIIAKHFL